MYYNKKENTHVKLCIQQKLRSLTVEKYKDYNKFNLPENKHILRISFTLCTSLHKLKALWFSEN